VKPDQTEHFSIGPDGAVSPAFMRIDTVLAQLPDPAFTWQRWHFGTQQWTAIAGETGSHLNVMRTDVGDPFLAVRCAVTSGGETYHSSVVAIHATRANRVFRVESEEEFPDPAVTDLAWGDTLFYALDPPNDVRVFFWNNAEWEAGLDLIVANRIATGVLDVAVITLGEAGVLKGHDDTELEAGGNFWMHGSGVGQPAEFRFGNAAGSRILVYQVEGAGIVDLRSGPIRIANDGTGYGRVRLEGSSPSGLHRYDLQLDALTGEATLDVEQWVEQWWESNNGPVRLRINADETYVIDVDSLATDLLFADHIDANSIDVDSLSSHGEEVSAFYLIGDSTPSTNIGKLNSVALTYTNRILWRKTDSTTWTEIGTLEEPGP